MKDSDALGLSRQQEDQAKERLVDANSTVDLRLADAYHWLLVPVSRSRQSSQSGTR
ncbi:MAG: hypothetical protein M3066_10045 [Actinomycetota bacterium]|nr:hypothetical protein [Actinomycetota bacterium]